MKNLDNQRTHLKRNFKIKLFKICSMCFFVLALSQIDQRFTTQMQTLQIAYNSGSIPEQLDMSLTTAQLLSYISDLAQVIHLTTALFLIVIGTNIEYSTQSNLIIFWITGSVSVFKIISGVFVFFLTKDKRIHTKTVDEGTMILYNWGWISFYRSVPFELFFAMADSVKYVQFVFIAKWLQRKYLITIIGFWFIFQGICSNIEEQNAF